MSKTYIHYGYATFDLQLFEEPANTRWQKPRGGLWASAIDAQYGWKDWAKDNSYVDCGIQDSFMFELTSDANVIHINTVSDVDKLPLQQNSVNVSGFRAIDFERLCRDGVDAIAFNLSNDRQLYWGLYGWDCDCLLVLNKKVIKILETPHKNA